MATVTFDTAFAGGETLTLAAEAVTDVATNPGPAQDVIATAVDLTGPSVTGSTDLVIGDDTWDITFDQALEPTSLTCDDISVSAGQGEACATTSVSTDGLVATVTFSDPFGGDEIVTLASDSVEDLSGNTGPTEAHSKTLPPSPGA